MVQIYLLEANPTVAGGGTAAVWKPGIGGSTYPAPTATDSTVNISVDNATKFTLKIIHVQTTSGAEITKAQLTAGTAATATPDLLVTTNSSSSGFPSAPGATAPEKTNYMDRLAFAVTGADDNTPDVFTNTAAIETQFATTFATLALADISAKLTTNVLAAARNVAGVLFDETPERFKLFCPGTTLPANHVTGGDVATGFIPITGNTYSMDQAGVGKGAGGKAVVTVNSDGSVGAITMSDAGTVSTPYVDSVDITITSSAGGTLTIPAFALTPFRLALINNSLATSTTVEIPVETDDSFIVQCKIGAPTNQKEDDGTTTANCDYSQNLKFVAAY